MVGCSATQRRGMNARLDCEGLVHGLGYYDETQ